MRPTPTSSTPNAQYRQSSLHSTTYSAAGMGAGGLPRAQGLPSPSDLASMYTRQFAMSKTAAPSIYQAAASAAAATANQTYTHGLTVLQCARSRAPADPHVYRDWLIFEERLKQSYRRLQRKRRNYLVQIIAFGVLVVYFAWFGLFGTKSYRLTCKLLSAGSAYCIYLIVTNRRFLQSIKYPTQCNRALHQFRIRFETSPLHAPNPFMVATAVVSAATSTDSAAILAATPGAELTQSDVISGPASDDSPLARLPRFMTESQLSFFPTVPRQLRDGYVEFKATYYRKRDAAKKRLQERVRRDKQRRPSFSSPGFAKAGERRPKQRAQNDQHSPCRESSPLLAAYSSGNSLGLGSFLSGADSATDDSSTTTSSVLSRRPPSAYAYRRPGSGLAYSLSEQASGSDGESSLLPTASHL
ncbi:hypothetical protein GGI20_001152 [Coemansia sp. BCRC 34301]|nr:hypothetical protein GGI20_001152 [Coemansia sp. BCRC 34301]